MFFCQGADGIHVAQETGYVDGENGSRAVGNTGGYGLGADERCAGFGVGEDRDVVFFEQAHDRAVVGDGRYDDFIAGFEIERGSEYVEGCGASGCANAVFDAHFAFECGFKSPDHVALQARCDNFLEVCLAVWTHGARKGLGQAARDSFKCFGTVLCAFLYRHVTTCVCNVPARKTTGHRQRTTARLPGHIRQADR